MPIMVGFIGGCATTETVRVECTQYSTQGKSVGAPFMTMNGTNADGELCYRLGDQVLDTLLAAPDVSDHALVVCRNNESFEGQVSLGDMYDNGFRVANIDRGYITVNSIKFPTGSWIYVLEKEQP